MTISRIAISVLSFSSILTPAAIAQEEFKKPLVKEELKKPESGNSKGYSFTYSKRNQRRYDAYANAMVAEVLAETLGMDVRKDAGSIASALKGLNENPVAQAMVKHRLREKIYIQVIDTQYRGLDLVRINDPDGYIDIIDQVDDQRVISTTLSILNDMLEIMDAAIAAGTVSGNNTPLFTGSGEGGEYTLTDLAVDLSQFFASDPGGYTYVGDAIFEHKMEQFEEEREREQAGTLDGDDDDALDESSGFDDDDDDDNAGDSNNQGQSPGGDDDDPNEDDKEDDDTIGTDGGDDTSSSGGLGGGDSGPPSNRPCRDSVSADCFPVAVPIDLTNLIDQYKNDYNSMFAGELAVGYVLTEIRAQTLQTRF